MFCIFSHSLPVFVFCGLCTLQLVRSAFAHEQNVLDEPWGRLRERVAGRLYPGFPLASPCFSSDLNVEASPSCEAVELGYLKESFRSSNFPSFINTQWETCQLTGEQCLLDYTNPSNPVAIEPPNRCQLGSVSRNYIDVRRPEDIVAAFEFSRKTRIPLVIKNTGHDYKGRSSAPNSLALWTHNLKNMSYTPTFTPDGCSDTYPAVTLGAGVQWGDAYEFAEANNITLVGGSDQSVGTSGGWLQGGGHGALTNTMGMGVDRVLQYRVVTPDGKYRVVNACRNKDLFFALRGGGGGTFAVVLESTVLASPRVILQSVTVAFAPNATLTQRLLNILVDNGLKWADDGFGGFVTPVIAILLTPKLNKQEAAVSLAPLIDFGKWLKSVGAKGAFFQVVEYSSWSAFFQPFVQSHVAIVGSSVALASRLIPKTNFFTNSSRATLVSALIAADTAAPGLLILLSPPSSFPGDGKTSVTDAWRDSVYHVTVVSQWNYNATIGEKRGHYHKASEIIDNLRRITPDAAYLNEADVYEPNYRVAFWGRHYPELLRIKEKYDPERLLDCWQCVGWNPKSPRFSCYL